MSRVKKSRKSNLALVDKDQKWAEIIAMTEENIKRSELKAIQLKALLQTFRRQQAAGEPTPLEIIEQKQTLQ